MILIFVAVIVLIWHLYLRTLVLEGFYQVFNNGTRFKCPTRNQSYDLRGDPFIISRVHLLHNNSGFGPLHPEDCHGSKLL